MLMRNTPIRIYIWMLEYSEYRGTIKDRASTAVKDVEYLSGPGRFSIWYESLSIYARWGQKRDGY